MGWTERSMERPTRTGEESKGLSTGKWGSGVRREVRKQSTSSADGGAGEMHENASEYIGALDIDVVSTLSWR